MRQDLLDAKFRLVGATPVKGTYLGLDPSLSGYGVAILDRGRVYVREYATPPSSTRFVKLEATVAAAIALSGATRTAIEGYAFGSQNQTTAGEVGGISRLALQKHGMDYLDVTPGTLKKHVCGKGNAKKAMMLLQLFKRFHIEARTDNEADAIGLALYLASLDGENHGESKPEHPAPAKRKRDDGGGNPQGKSRKSVARKTGEANDQPALI